MDSGNAPDIAFLDTLAVLVLLPYEYAVVGLVACQVVVLFDCRPHCLVQVLEDGFSLAQQSVCGTLVHIKTVFRKVLDDAFHGHGVDVAQLGDAGDEGAVIVGAQQRGDRCLALHDGSVLSIDMYVIDSLDEAHGYEDVAHHIVSVYQTCLQLVKAWVRGIDILLLDLHLIVLLASGPVVGLLSRLRLCLGYDFCIRNDLWSLFLRLVLLYLRQTLDDIVLFPLLCLLQDKQLL